MVFYSLLQNLQTPLTRTTIAPLTHCSAKLLERLIFNRVFRCGSTVQVHTLLEPLRLRRDVPMLAVRSSARVQHLTSHCVLGPCCVCTGLAFEMAFRAE